MRAAPQANPLRTLTSPLSVLLPLQPLPLPYIILVTANISVWGAVQSANASDLAFSSSDKSGSASHSSSSMPTGLGQPGLRVPEKTIVIRGPFSEDPELPQSAALDFGGLADLLVMGPGTQLYLQSLLLTGLAAKPLPGRLGYGKPAGKRERVPGGGGGLGNECTTALPLWGINMPCRWAGGVVWSAWGSRSVRSCMVPLAARYEALCSHHVPMRMHTLLTPCRQAGLAPCLHMHNVTLVLPAREFVMLRRAALRVLAEQREGAIPADDDHMGVFAASKLDPLQPPSQTDQELHLSLLQAYGINATHVRLVPDAPVGYERVSDPRYRAPRSHLSLGLGLGLGLGLVGFALLIATAGLQLWQQRLACRVDREGAHKSARQEPGAAENAPDWSGGALGAAAGAAAVRGPEVLVQLEKDAAEAQAAGLAAQQEAQQQPGQPKLKQEDLRAEVQRIQQQLQAEDADQVSGTVHMAARMLFSSRLCSVRHALLHRVRSWVTCMACPSF